MATRRQELYIIAMETDQTLRYHIWIESQCLYSLWTHWVMPLLMFICAYFVFNIAYPKPMYLFLQHFVLGLKVSQKVPTSVSTLWSSHLVCTSPPPLLHNACILHALACLYSTIALVCVLCHTTAFNVTFSSSHWYFAMYLYAKPTTIKFDVYSFNS